MLNFDDWGGYLIETLGRTVFIDGRADIYEPNGVLLDYLHIVYPQSKTPFLLRKYHIDSCLMPADSALVTMLSALPNWKVACRDTRSVLLVRAANPNAGISTVDIRKEKSQREGNIAPSVTAWLKQRYAMTELRHGQKRAISSEVFAPTRGGHCQIRSRRLV